MATRGADPARRAARRSSQRGLETTAAVRFYQVAVLDPSGLLGYAIEVAPPTTVKNDVSVVNRLEFAIPISASALTQVLWGLIAADSDDEAYNLLQSRDLFAFAQGRGIPDEIFRLMEYVAFAPIVPTEHSPIDGDSLANIAQQGMAFVGAVQRNPIVLIEGAGMLVVLSAIRRWGSAVVDVGEQAIRYHLPGLLRTPRKDK